MIYTIMLFILWSVIWLALSWPPHRYQVVLAVVVSIFITLLTVDTFSAVPSNSKKKSLVDIIARIPWFCLYLVVFLWECLKANVDVAYRVIHPSMPIRPGTIKIKIDLKTDIALTFLANTLTLTPGRTTIDIDKERGYIYVHKLYLTDSEIHEHGRKGVVEKFERILKRIFE